jgi:CRP/FNR family transcriptional regulator
MHMVPSATRSYGPAIRAIDQWCNPNSSPGLMRQLLTEDERARLAAIASIVRFKKGAEIYRAGDRTDAVFNIVRGVVKAYKMAPDGSEYISAFLFPDDIFGLSEDGQYVNSTKAVTPVTAYLLPVSQLRTRLVKDADLEFHVIAKLCHELRQAQRHAFLLAQRRGVPKIAMFLQFLEQLQTAKKEPASDIYLPMDRSTISEYVGMSLPAVSRAFRRLTADGIIEFRNRKHVKIVNRLAFEKLAEDPYSLRAPGSVSR